MTSSPEPASLQRGCPAARCQPERCPNGRFQLADALRDGWSAFHRAPLSFVVFAALLTGLQLSILPLQERLQLDLSRNAPRDLLLLPFVIGISLLISLWGSQGMVRGAWAALQGQRPSLANLLRWDGSGFNRLLQAWGALAVALLIPLAVLLVTMLVALWLLTVAAGGPPSLIQFATLLINLLALAAFAGFGLLLGYFSINQQFLAQLALLENGNGAMSVQRGRMLVDRQWLSLVGLQLIKGLLLLLGILLAFDSLGLSWLLAWPLVSCISTAAYRQLIHQEQQAAAAAGSPVSADQSPG